MPRRPKGLRWYAVIRISDGAQLYTNTNLSQAAVAWVPGTMLGIGTERTDAIQDAEAKIKKYKQAELRVALAKERMVA